MRQNRDYYLLRMGLSFAFFMLMTCSAMPLLAQKTVVQDAGGGRKVELDYNAAGQVTEQRTISVDGKLLERVEFEYHPGFFGADQTNTSYWPDGRVNKIARNTYDASSNFTGEFIQVFDESGKQIAGHRLTHNPMTNVYTCSDWNPASQSYKLIECPSGEGSGGKVEAVKKFTYDEVMQHLEAARKAATQEQNAQPKTLAKLNAGSAEVGLIAPAQVYPGERISGSVVVNPAKYEGEAGVTVTRIALPLGSAGEASTLAGWTVEVPSEGPQRAAGPIVLTVPRTGSGLNITLRQTGDSAHSVSTLVNFAHPSVKEKKAPKAFEAAALCMKGQLCLVRGPFSGDSSKTFAAFEDRPAMVMAEAADTAYIRIPELTEAGARPLFLAEGSKVIALPVAVGEFSLVNVDRELQPGQTLMTFPTLDGPSEIPDGAWQLGNFPATNLEQARQLIPGFQLPHENREAREEREAKEKGEAKDKRERDEKKGGTILLVLKNVTPEQIKIRGANDQTIIFHLNDESFSRGMFKYDLPVDAIKSGHFEVKGYVIPFLAPVPGQEFSVKSGSGLAAK